MSFRRQKNRFIFIFCAKRKKKTVSTLLSLCVSFCVCFCGFVYMRYRYSGFARWQQNPEHLSGFCAKCVTSSPTWQRNFKWARQCAGLSCTSCVSLCKDVQSMSACMLIIFSVSQCCMLVKVSLSPLVITGQKKKQIETERDRVREIETGRGWRGRVCERCNVGRE